MPRNADMYCNLGSVHQFLTHTCTYTYGSLFTCMHNITTKLAIRWYFDISSKVLHVHVHACTLYNVYPLLVLMVDNNSLLQASDLNSHDNTTS